MNTYQRAPLSFVQGKGSYLIDEKGQSYLDFTSGIATCNLGHVPDSVKAAVQQQLNQLWHCTNLFQIPAQEELAHLLTKVSGLDQVFFCNSGAEANEGAIKLARRYAQIVKQNGKYEVVSFTQSFHGRTLATLTATGQGKIQEGFSPLPQGFRTLPYNDLAALDELVSTHTCGVLLELVQGEGGVRVADPTWVKKLVSLCRQHELLLIIDEVQTGMGRTGTFYAYEQYGLKPDIVTAAKGLGSGFPIGAILATTEAAKGFEPGSHGSTFGGNPLATTAGIATLKALEAHQVLTNAKAQSQYLWKQLQELRARFPLITDLRGRGLLIGLEIQGDATQIVELARLERVLILTAGPGVLRILPPLTTKCPEVDHLINALEKSLQKLAREEPH